MEDKEKRTIHDVTLSFTVHTDNYYPSEEDVLKALVAKVKMLVKNRSFINVDTKIIRSFDRGVTPTGINVLSQRGNLDHEGLSYATDGINPCKEIQMPKKGNSHSSGGIEYNNGLWPTF